MAIASCPCSAAAAASSTGCDAPSRNEKEEWQWSSTYGMRRSRALLEPSPSTKVAEDDRVAASGEDQLEVAAPQRAAGPPAILDHPLLGDEIARLATERGGRPPPGPAHMQGARPAEAPNAHRRGPSPVSNGASTARRSGNREAGSTSSTRSAASAPAACRA